MVLIHKKILGLFLVVSCMLILAFIPDVDSPSWDNNTPVHEILFALGEKKPDHFMKKITPELIKRGEELILKGQSTSPKGKRSERISKYYQCTTCHNLVQEDPDLTSRDPEMRLDYVAKKKLPFLQATTFHGIVNRETWYNDDYVKKYGDLVRKANKSLEESIQLCATECAQGRLLEKWEMNAVVAYYWSIGFKMGELGFSEEEWKEINSIYRNEDKHQSIIDLIKSKYMLKSPATFGEVPNDKVKGYEGLEGRPDKGKLIYELSCQQCHRDEGVSWFILDNNKLTFKQLVKDIPKDKHFALYDIIRHGTYAVPGHRPYMPHYPEERMSNQQIEDLRSYIEQEAGVKTK
ncbi:MAG: cytochrome c [Bacteroidia bacterium]|nr:cytochrome c [Bacteroidia bacterium]